MAPALAAVRVISLDVTGTLIRHRHPIFETYAAALRWAEFPNPPTAAELKPAFKSAYKATLLEYPCFGTAAGLSSKQWWVKAVTRCLEQTGRKAGADYNRQDFDRFFRRVYQHYGCPEGYAPMDDAMPFVKWATSQGYLLGLTTNTPQRTMESVIPFMGFHHFLRFFVCSHDVGAEKPDRGIFDAALAEIEHHRGRIVAGSLVDEIPGDEGTTLVNKYRILKKGSRATVAIQPHEILHVGDGMESDLCGPKACGWQAIHLDRSGDANVRQYQDWLVGPEYPGKCGEDIGRHTATSFAEIRRQLEDARRPETNHEE
mmetsp:Transcript_11906/g.31466  ORF Transcript_11906/g.31466 Transcript_11906/m.31466 type:complete len:315 (-) Transcript_11906:134-1078(-)